MNSRISVKDQLMARLFDIKRVKRIPDMIHLIKTRNLAKTGLIKMKIKRWLNEAVTVRTIPSLGNKILQTYKENRKIKMLL